MNNECGRNEDVAVADRVQPTRRRPHKESLVILGLSRHINMEATHILFLRSTFRLDLDCPGCLGDITQNVQQWPNFATYLKMRNVLITINSRIPVHEPLPSWIYAQPPSLRMEYTDLETIRYIDSFPHMSIDRFAAPAATGNILTVRCINCVPSHGPKDTSLALGPPLPQAFRMHHVTGFRTVVLEVFRTDFNGGEQPAIERDMDRAIFVIKADLERALNGAHVARLDLRGQCIAGRKLTFRPQSRAWNEDQI